MDQTVKQSVIDRLSQANNVLVTVKSNPDVDQLSACIGFTLFLNKIGKHATAVYSGKTPSTLEFLKPEETIEKNTDSLRDFIIALDKSKADKLRYKVEDDVVRIFITPYKTSISEKDLYFTQGDFNVDAVVALGVHNKQDLDRAITAHGRILHDATVISINNDSSGDIGVLNLQDSETSSLSEMLVDISETLQADSFDSQMATAFLTGIVAKTKRFSNDKTTPRTMTLSAKLMAAGANQQLIASELQATLNSVNQQKETKEEESETEIDAITDEDGTLHIKHKDDGKTSKDSDKSKKYNETIEKLEEELGVNHDLPAVSDKDDKEGDSNTPEDTSDDEQTSAIRDVKAGSGSSSASQTSEASSGSSKEPSTGGTLTANTKPEGLSPSVDPLASNQPQDGPTLEHGKSSIDGQNKTRADLDSSQDSSFTEDLGSKDSDATDGTNGQTSKQDTQKAQSPDLDSARDAVEDAAEQSSDDNRPDPLAAIGSQPLDMNVQGQSDNTDPNSNSLSTSAGAQQPVGQNLTNQDTAFSTPPQQQYQQPTSDSSQSFQSAQPQEFPQTSSMNTGQPQSGPGIGNQDAPGQNAQSPQNLPGQDQQANPFMSQGGTPQQTAESVNNSQNNGQPAPPPVPPPMMPPQSQ